MGMVIILDTRWRDIVPYPWFGEYNRTSALLLQDTRSQVVLPLRDPQIVTQGRSPITPLKRR
jgi:hypothetical protein